MFISTSLHNWYLLKHVLRTAIATAVALRQFLDINSQLIAQDSQWRHDKMQNFMYFGAVHKWRHAILGKNLPPAPLVTFRHKYLTPRSNITSQFANLPPFTFAITNFHLFCVCLDKSFHLFYRFDLCTLWQDQHSIRKTSKILHTLLSKNYAAKCFLLCWRPKRMNYVVRMLAMTDCGYSPVYGFTVVVALQYWSKNKS